MTNCCILWTVLAVIASHPLHECLTGSLHPCLPFCSQAVREADEEIILHQLDSSDLLKAQCAEDPALSSECFKLLWTHATFLFDNRQFPRAIPVYNAAMEFASSAQEKARAARTVGLCYLGLQDYARCADHPCCNASASQGVWCKSITSSQTRVLAGLINCSCVHTSLIATHELLHQIGYLTFHPGCPAGLSLLCSCLPSCCPTK